jgi:hypothetical protein
MAEQEILVVGSKVKAFISALGLRSDGELVAAVSTKVEQLLKDAVERAKTNNRQTVRPGDL